MSAGRHRNRTIMTAGVGALAVVVHLGVWLGGRADPSWQEPLVDARTYHELAVGLVQDGTLDARFLWQAPFFPLFLALVYKVFGISLTAVHLVQTGLGAATCMLTARLGRRVAGSPAGMLAGVVLALSGPFVFFNLQLLATGWATFWMVVLAHLALDAGAEGASYRRSLVLGLAGSLALLTRPTFGLLLVFLLGVLLFRRRDGKRAAALLAGIVLVLLPFGMTMHTLTGHDGLLPPSGAINLHIGNNPDFAETINIRVGLPWEKLVGEPERHGFGNDPWSGQPYFREQVFRYWREDPLGALGLLWRKGLHLVSSRELPRNLDIYVHREWSPLLGALVWKVGAWGFPLGILLPLAALGWGPGRTRAGTLPAVMTLVYGAGLVVIFVAARYRVAMLPLVAVAAVQGGLWLVAQVRGRRVRRLVLLAPALVLLLGLITLPGPFAQEKVDLRGELFYGVGWNAYQREQWDVAEEYFRQAVAASPEMPEAHQFLALALTRREAWDEACAEFAAAVALAPDYSEAERNLERCRQRRVERNYRRAWALEGEDPAAALALYEEIFAERPGWLEGRVRLAWMLATVPLENLQDRARARRLMDDPAVRAMKNNSYIRQVREAVAAD